MAKHLCKLVKEKMPEHNLNKYLKKVKKAKYICTNCGRVARKESFLCKPVKI